jgi:hypothetical protein
VTSPLVPETKSAESTFLSKMPAMGKPSMWNCARASIPSVLAVTIRASSPPMSSIRLPIVAKARFRSQRTGFWVKSS